MRSPRLPCMTIIISAVSRHRCACRSNRPRVFQQLVAREAPEEWSSDICGNRMTARSQIRGRQLKTGTEGALVPTPDVEVV